MNAQDGRGPGRRVLIVDDNVDSARMMRVLLRYEGHDVRIAHSGHEALKVVRDFLPDVVLLDLFMPGMSGAEVAAALRTDVAAQGALIIAISGYDEDGLPPGFDHLMVKPVHHDALLRLITTGPGIPATAARCAGSPQVVY
jgi:CheY-like chemotaxis protein